MELIKVSQITTKLKGMCSDQMQTNQDVTDQGKKLGVR